MQGKYTSEYKQSRAVVIASVVLPIVGLMCELLVEHSILESGGVLAVAAGLISSAIASAGYSSSRARTKSAELQSEALKKKSIVFLSEKDKKRSGP